MRKAGSSSRFSPIPPWAAQWRAPPLSAISSSPSRRRSSDSRDRTSSARRSAPRSPKASRHPSSSSSTASSIASSIESSSDRRSSSSSITLGWESRRAAPSDVTNAILCRWVVLGAGTIVPQPSRSPASHCLEIVAAGGRQAILFDLGPGALARAGDQGFGLEEIRHVVITHFHPDHCADLVALLFAWRLPRFASSEPPVLWGPKGIRQLVRNLAGAWGAWVEPGDRFRIEEVEPGSDLDIDGLRITPYSTLHTDHSLAYRIESPQVAVAAYTGDTGEGGDIVAAARDADLLVIECAVPDGEEIEGHLAPAAV